MKKLLFIAVALLLSLVACTPPAGVMHSASPMQSAAVSTATENAK